MRKLRERAEPILKIVCLVLAALVLCQLAGIFIRWNPFRGVTVPALPSLASHTNSPTGSGHGTNLVASAAGKGTNSAKHSTGTNATTSVTNKISVSPTANALNGTNSAAVTSLATTGTKTDTNMVSRLETKLSGTNSAASTNAAGTNLLISATATTNTAPSAAGIKTNSNGRVEPEMTRTNAETNVSARLATKLRGTNSAPATNAPDKNTNVLLASTAAGTNIAHGPKPEMKSTNAAPVPSMAGMNFSQPPGKSSMELPPAEKSRIGKIVDSEILGPVMHPLPMALLGIAGDVAFLRSAHGQTGLVKEGDSLDDIKLLRIGINRVLIEQGGEKKELMIFEGYGGNSLLQNNTTNENNDP